ncbi:protein FAM149B1-like isoform X2 [Pomacea canaliculata]|uniref:protein FAM149B1-like isoform X2 n=1 Tax=Pomacea canaliculata TaxID=400727 RepID=UPI000D73C094|nr:protein FAM149B1-like isoform X2 [Pomacea canaliculata]
MAACSGWESRPPEDFRATPETMGSAELCEQWLGLHRQPYPYPPDLYGVSLPPISLEKGCNTPPRSSRPPGGGGGGPHASSHWPPLFGMTSSPFSSGHSFRGVAEDELIVRGRALQRTPLQDRPLPEPADEHHRVVAPSYSLSTVLGSNYPQTPSSSGRSSPIAETQSTTSAFQLELTTGYTTERSNSSCYSLDDFERQASSTVNKHFEEFESMLYEGKKGTSSTVSQECHEWITQFPHLRVLGKKIQAPQDRDCDQDTGYEFIPPSSVSTSRPSTSGTAELDLTNNDITFTPDTQGLTLSGRKVKPIQVPPEIPSPELFPSCNQYDFLHEEVFEQDGIYEDIIAVDYKNIYDENMEHKKQITPRRRRVGYPPVTPNACVKDSVSSEVFDSMWQEIMSWLRVLVRKYAAEILDAKKQGAGFSTGRSLAPTPPFRASSFISRPYSVQGPHLMDGNVSFDGVLKISTMILKNRNSQSTDLPDTSSLISSTVIGPVSRVGSRPSTVSTHTAHPRLRQGPTRSFLQPLTEPFRPTMDDKGSRQNPQDILSVRQIVPTTSLALQPSGLTRQSTLPPLESSSSQSETPFSSINRRSSTPLSQSIASRHPVSFLHPSLNITGSALHPLGEPTTHLPVSLLPPNILEDPETPMEDIRHNQWMPNTPSNKTYIRRMRTHLRL